ncbi:MAG TPA: hypothetical protein DHD79_09760 [Firmicutes bacterium]|jgi:cbb3-type cytochrome oxidase subunit 3|nr:hypothetical protein [Bacillota bacterium]HBL67747.1 hypothetical protein [Bacillota bacterium]HCF89057.1 hypothetical protein [Bacillota bacterium]HCX71510.1 hypothetical protein [Bacillota bacterium]
MKTKWLILALIIISLGLIAVLYWNGKNTAQSSQSAANPAALAESDQKLMDTSAPFAQDDNYVPPFTLMSEVDMEHTLAGISLLDTPDEVKAVLGEPLSTEYMILPFHYDPLYLERYDTWTYDGVVVEFRRMEDYEPESPGSVADIFVTGGTYESMLGVKVGASVSEVQEVYKDHLRDYYEIGRICLDFDIDDGVVAGMLLYVGAD